MKKKIIALFFLLILAIPCFVISSVTALADENPIMHTVEFKVDGETYKTVEVADGKKIMIIPETPLKNGSIFDYWEIEDPIVGARRFSFVGETVQSDLTLTAKWKVITKYFKVTFKVNGETVNVQEVEQGKNAVAPNNFVLPEGKKLKNWDGDFSIVTENITINAVLEDEQYLVRIIGFDGEEYSKMNVVYGETVTLPEQDKVPAVAYHSFVGYDYNGQPITKDTDIKMIYTPNEYTVTFECEGQEPPVAQQIKYGGTVKFPTTPTKTDYIFVGWYTENSETPYDFNLEVREDLHLIAKFIPKEKPKYTVTFYTHDGIQYGGTQLVEEGSSAITPGSPSRYGYKFRGWTENYSSVTKDLKIYPIYEINEYNVEFICGDDVIETQTVKYGGSATKPTAEVPEIEGYEFIGWDRQLGNVTDDTEIHAVYRVKTFAVMFYDENNKKIGSTQYVEYGKSALAPKLDTKVGYTFNGWSDGKVISLDAYKNITKEVTFVAEYSPITYTVKFYHGIELKKEVTVNHGNYAPLYTYTNGDQIFGGWFSDNAFSNVFDFATPITQDVDLYAKWDKKPDVFHTVTFKVDEEVYFQYMVVDGGSVTAPGIPTKEGHTFKGWSETATDVKTDLEIKAIFEKNKYTLTFYYGDNKNKQVQVEHDGLVVAPTEDEVYKEGYDFMGWDVGFEAVNKDMVIYAKYERISVSVTFINGTDQFAVQSMYYGEFPKVISAPSKTGHSFVGWYLDKNFTTPFNFNTPLTQVVKVYAKFEVNEYSIIYYLDGIMHQTISVEYGAEITPLKAPEFDGNRVFLGWSEIPSVMPAQTVVVTGSSKQLGTYKIEYYINSKLYETVEYVEGQTVQPLGSPTDLDETIVFKGWRNEPTEMPAYNIKIHADVENLRYFNIYYYVNGRFNISQMVLQGKPVVAPERPQGTLPENEVFNGWINVPEFMPTNHIRIDADITFLQYYTVRYYIDGYARFVQQALEGKKFTVMRDPSNSLQEDKIFNYWTYDENGDGNPVRVDCGSSMYMPNHDIEIHANITKLQYFNIKYYIGDLLYFTRPILQGKTVTPFDAPSSLPETTVFHAWIGEPEIMPDHDVRVEADYTKYEYYVLSFYVGDRFYCSERLLEGKPFSLPDAPTDLPENIVFECWDYLGDFIMPNHDLTIYANYRELHEYVISYYINGTLYWTQSILEGKPVEVIDAPIETPDNIVFISWGYVPEFMPSENVTINAEIRVLVEYDINYYVNGVLYRTVKVLEGKAVTPMGEPYDQPDYIIFNGWIDEPTIMPSHNVDVHADVTILSANQFVITFSEVVDGKFTVTVEVKGLVNFAGFVAEVIYDSNFTVTGFWYDEDKGYTYGEDNHGKIVWSQGVNTTEQITLIELEFDAGGSESVDYSQVQFNVYDIVVIDDNGNVVTAEYSVEYKNK